MIAQLEIEIGNQLAQSSPGLSGTSSEALKTAGVWVDAPSAPKFEDVDDIVTKRMAPAGLSSAQIFPIREWTQAYQYYRYEVRIFAFSEYYDVAARAAKAAMKKVIGIESDSFYESIRRVRN